MLTLPDPDPYLIGPWTYAPLIAVLLAYVIGVTLSTLSAALEALSIERLKAVRDSGTKESEIAGRLLTKQSKVRSRLLVGRIACIAVVAIGTALQLRAANFGPLAFWVGEAIVVMLFGMSAEFLLTAARNHADRIALRLYRICYPLELFFAPLALPLHFAAQLSEKIFSIPEETVTEDIAEREMEHLIEKREEEGALPEEYAQLMLRVLEFKETVAREVMVPRTQMVAIDINTPLDALVKKVVDEGHSRYPIYRERIDKIEGILYAKDLFTALREKKDPQLSKLIRRSVFFAPETQKIGKLLREMQSRRVHLAVVLDEFGGTAGIVTLEDILEEIVGEIHDEHDSDENMVAEIGPGRYLVDARVSIHDLAELLGVEIGDDEQEGTYDSLGGFVVETLGRVPAPQDELSAFGYDFVVREVDDRRVIRVEVRRRPSTRPPTPRESVRTMAAVARSGVTPPDVEGVALVRARNEPQ